MGEAGNREKGRAGSRATLAVTTLAAQ